MEEHKKANAGSLGLLGFGLTTLMLNLCNVGAFQLNIMIAAMGFAAGGLAQIIAGIIEFKNGNTFGGTAFTAFGLFWWSLVLIWWNPMHMGAPDHIALGCYLMAWGVFTAFMFIGTLKHNVITMIVFGSLALLFVMLSVGEFSGSSVVTTIAGAIGILCATSAFYSAMGQIINNEYGKKVFPL